jgi:hypothetical protein
LAINFSKNVEKQGVLLITQSDLALFKPLFSPFKTGNKRQLKPFNCTGSALNVPFSGGKNDFILIFHIVKKKISLNN